jgi:phospholipase A1
MNDFSRRPGFALLFAAISTAGTALAQTTPSLAECAAIDSDSERLACYDRAAGRPAATTPAPGKEAPAAAAEQPAPAAGALRAPASLIDAAWGFEKDSNSYVIDLYNQNYLLVARYSDNVNNAPFTPVFQAFQQYPQPLDSTEAKFQLSFKLRLWTTDDRRWGVWAAYTQQSQWQVYNGELSRPFRETNYMPELFVSYTPRLDLGGGFHWRLLNLGYVHQSNGQGGSLSRSWDRLFAEFGVERDRLALLARLWYRLPENASKDDNPDITDYYGYGSLTAIYKWRGHSFSLMGRGNISTGKGAAQFTWMSPRFLGLLRGYVQAFTGYGESLIDYNWNQSTIGIGIALNDAL